MEARPAVGIGMRMTRVIDTAEGTLIGLDRLNADSRQRVDSAAILALAREHDLLPPVGSQLAVRVVCWFAMLFATTSMCRRSACSPEA